MTSQYQEQAQRLLEFRRNAGGQSSQRGDHRNGVVNGNVQPQTNEYQPVADPLIYPGLYAPSGMDLMSILIQVYRRPNPQIQIGNVDSAVALVVCDAEAPDFPTVYCSEPFEALTGYGPGEILGRNCRFLQHPTNARPCLDPEIIHFNATATRELKNKIVSMEETRARVVNFKKDGTSFVNAMTLIPIAFQGDGPRPRNYIVGFQADEGRR